MASSSELQFQFGQIIPALHLIETEDSWQKIDGALTKLETITKSGGYKQENFVLLIKEHSVPIVNSLLSERTRLSGSAADLVTSVAPRLANRFEPLISTFVPPLLQLCARTNKIQLVRAKKCLLLIAKHCKLASLFPLLRDASRDKSITLRNVAVEVALTLMESIESNEKIERRIGDIELIIKSTATDRDPEVRQWSKRVFELYIEQFPERVAEFTAAFTPTTKRYLAISNVERQAGPSSVQRRPLQRIQPSHAVQKKPFVEQVEEAKSVRAVSSSSAKHSSSQTTSTANKRQRDTSTAPSSRSTSAQHSSRNAEVKNNSNRTFSSSSAKGRVQEKQIEVPPAIPSPEERERAMLRAEVARQSAATPSRGIAARLALEQFEMRVRSGTTTSTAMENGGNGGKRGAALTAFAVAASKKHSPRRLPVRIPLPPASVEQKKMTTSIPEQKIAQRVMKPVSRPCSPDVFDSKPMPKEATMQRNKAFVKPGLTNTASANKRTSTLTKNMSARGKLLGNSTVGGGGVNQRVGGNVRPMKSSIPVASPKMKFFASPNSTKKNEGEINQLEDYMEALTVSTTKAVTDSPMQDQQVYHPKEEFDSHKPECISEEGMENKRMKFNFSPSQKITQPGLYLSPRSIMTSRKTPTATRPAAFIFGRMAPMVVAGKKI